MTIKKKQKIAPKILLALLVALIAAIVALGLFERTPSTTHLEKEIPVGE